MKLRRITLALLLFASFPFAALAQDAAKQALNEQMWEATRRGDAAEVRALLDKGADVNAKFRYGTTALFKAAEKGHTEVVKLLLERGADATVKDTFYGATAMTWALNHKHVEVVRALLEKGGSVDEVLMKGAREANADLIRVALDKGGAKPETLTSALAAATGDGKTDIAEMLRKAGAQPPFEVDAATLQAYAGRYKPEQGGEINITLKDGKLHAQPTGQPQPFALLALDKTTFKPVAFDGISFTFVAEGDKVTGFTFKQGPNTTAYKKQ